MKETHSPTLLYALDEIAFQMVANDGLAVMRALLWLADGSTSFMVAPGVDTTWAGNETREFDGVLLIDGRVVLLEVKNTDQISSRQLAQYRAMANRISADEVCFATTKEWAPATLARIDQVCAFLQSHHIAVRSQALELAQLN